MRDPYQDLRSELVRAAERVDATPARRQRSWWRGRPRPLAITVAALVISGSAAAAIVSLNAKPSQPLIGKVPGTISSPAQGEAASLAGYRYTIQVTPSLSAGSAGWATSISYVNPTTGAGGASASGGGRYPERTSPLFEGTSLELVGGGQGGDSVRYVITGPTVAAVRVGARTIRTFASTQLPADDRAAVFFQPHSPHSARPRQGPRAGVMAIASSGLAAAPRAVVPLDRSGHAIRTESGTPDSSPSSFWQAPSAVTPNIHEPRYHGPTHPGPGACELSQRGFPALTPEWGHTLARITPVRDSVGELFLSCIDTEYYLNGTPLIVGVLLDARRPGRRLGDLPGARPVNGSPDLVDYHAANLSARRIGNAWIVVKGGFTTKRRIAVLRALRISKLDL